MSPDQLLFVYDADSGHFNAMADATHKILSPDTYSCNLCRVTHGWFSERRHWRAFIESLEVPCLFLHRDEFRQQYPDNDTALPGVFRVQSRTAAVCVDADALNACDDLDKLIALVRAHCIG